MLASQWDGPSVLLCVIGMIAFYFLATPLIILASQKMAARPDCEELQMHSLEPRLAQFIMDKTNALFALGFDEPALIHMSNPAPGVNAYLIMLVNRPQGDKVMVTALVGDAGLRIQTWYVEFSTRYDNDHCVDTLNSSELSAFQQGPQNIRTQVPSVTDVDELYRLHQFKMKNSGITGRKVLYEPGHAVEYLLKYAIKKGYDEQVTKGWLRYDAAEDCYRATIKGAYLMTWGLLQPIKMFRAMAMRQQEKITLAEFHKAE